MRFVLLSDFALGLTDDFLPISDEDRLDTLKNAIKDSADADAILIPGNIFTSISPEITDNLNSIFADRNGIDAKIIILLTEEERRMMEELNLDIKSADKIFTKDNEPFIIEKGNEKIYFYGSSRKDDIFLTDKCSEDGFHIGLFNLNIEEYAENEIEMKTFFKKLPLDFYALGGISTTKIFKVSGKIIAAYPGHAEACSAEENSAKYSLNIVTSDDSIYEIKRLPLKSTKFVSLTIDCDNSNLNDIEAMVDESKNSETRLYIRFDGMRNYPIDNFNLERKYKSVKIDDNSFPTLKQLSSEIETNGMWRDFFDLLNAKQIPEDVDIKELSRMIFCIIKNGSIISEDWICALLNA
ncbi:MAG TPA: hypothetical protein PLC67_02450 [Spirochaetota bacterium]|nr:hypothetical protein [Spirochaetota bacterium]